MSKLSIKPEIEADKYDTKITVICYSCGGKELDATNEKLSKVVDGVMSAMTSATQSEVKAWEQELSACEHTLCLEQGPAKKLEAQSNSPSSSIFLEKVQLM